MPGFDGTGPRGQGPMTGKAGGFCLLSIPDANDQPQRGFVGLAGNPLPVVQDSMRTEPGRLKQRLLGIETELRAVKERLTELEADNRAEFRRGDAS